MKARHERGVSRKVSLALAALACFTLATNSLAEAVTVKVAPGPLDRDGAIPVGDAFGACHADSYDVMAELGVKINRKDITWAAVEPADDAWNWEQWDARTSQLLAHNQTALPILDYGNLQVQTGTDHGNRIRTDDDLTQWLEYVQESVDRYYLMDPLHVSAWEIWNEPNLGDVNASTGFWTGTDEEFFRLHAATAKFLDEHYPGLTVVSGGISGHDPEYLSAMFEAGAMEGVDALAFHPYSGSAYDALGVKVAQVQEVAERYGFDGELWITEVGMSTQFDPGEPDWEGDYRERLELQASLVPKVYSIALAAGVSKVIWYCLGDFENWTWGEANFGLVFAPGNTFKPEPYRDDAIKPAGFAYAALARNLNWSTYYPRGAVVDGGPSASQLKAYYFLTGDGRVVLVVWNGLASDVDVTFEFPRPVSAVTWHAPPTYKANDSAASSVVEFVAGGHAIKARVGFYPLVLLVDPGPGDPVSVVLCVPLDFTDFSACFGVPVVVSVVAAGLVVDLRRQRRNG